jgi:hypothetical protein
MAYNKYHEGKIYRLLSKSRPDLIYYGSTIRTLNYRLRQHRYEAKKNNKNSKIIIDCGDAIIELVEDYPCENKRELLVREGLYINNNKCVNKRIPGQTSKEYRDKNKEIIIERKKKYRAENIEKIKEKKRVFYEENKDKNKEKRKGYYEKNKEKINEKIKEKYTCICGSIIRHGGKSEHERTQRHINYISTIDI